MAVDLEPSERVKRKIERFHAEQEEIREQWVKAMEIRILHEQLQKCYRMEGVNHYENCKEWAERYLKALRENRVKGIRKTSTE